MYCAKCGRRNSPKATICKECHAKLRTSQADLSAYREKVSNAQKEVSLAEGKAFYDECIGNAKEIHVEHSQSIDSIFLKRLDDSKISPNAKKQTSEDYHGLQADEDLSYSNNVKRLDSPEKAQKAKTDINFFAAQAFVTVPDSKDKTAAHAFVQYLHRRHDKENDHRENAMSFIAVGSILLIIGIIFLALSFKISTETYDRYLKFDSFEFVVAMFGIILGGSGLAWGIYQFVYRTLMIGRLKSAIFYYRIWSKLYQ